jgi:hypothetical protein
MALISLASNWDGLSPRDVFTVKQQVICPLTCLLYILIKRTVFDSKDDGWGYAQNGIRVVKETAFTMQSTSILLEKSGQNAGENR